MPAIDVHEERDLRERVERDADRQDDRQRRRSNTGDCGDVVGEELRVLEISEQQQVRADGGRQQRG
jgi:hypothetical protein